MIETQTRHRLYKNKLFSPARMFADWMLVLHSSQIHTVQLHFLLHVENSNNETIIMCMYVDIGTSIWRCQTYSSYSKIMLRLNITCFEGFHTSIHHISSHFGRKDLPSLLRCVCCRHGMAQTLTHVGRVYFASPGLSHGCWKRLSRARFSYFRVRVQTWTGWTSIFNS